MYFDGSDVGLFLSPDNNVDAVSVHPTGELLVSIAGSTNISGVFVRDNDLLKFDPASLGNVTSGDWAMYLDGSDIGLHGTAEGIQAATLMDGSVHISSNGAIYVPGLSGDGSDVFAFEPTRTGSLTEGQWTGVTFDAGLFGLEAWDIDGFHLAFSPVATRSLVDSAPSSGAVQLEMASDGTLYQLNDAGQIHERLPECDWVHINPVGHDNYQAVHLKVAPDGSIFQLNRLGQIYERRPGGSWLHINPVGHYDYQAVKMDMAPDGTLYQRNHLGQIYERRPGGHWVHINPVDYHDYQAVQMDMAPDGTLYQLNGIGQIYERHPEGNWVHINSVGHHDYQAAQLNMAPDGRLFQLNHLGQIYERRPGGNWVHINPVTHHDYQAVQLEMALDGTLYQLNYLGQVYGRPLGEGWTYLQQESFEFWHGKTYDEWLELNVL